jgi:hypothetical protein
MPTTISGQQFVWNPNSNQWEKMTQPTGGTGGTASNFGSGFPTVGTAAGFKDANGNMAAATLDASGNLLVDVAVASIPAGNDVTEGNTSDAAVTGDNTGTVNAHLRGIDKILADVWDSVNHWLKVNIQNATIAVTQSGTWALSAGTALIGRVASSDETSTIFNGTTALTPQFAAITANTTGATTVVAAVGGKQIRVTQVILISNGSVNVKFQTSTGPTDLTGLLYLASNTGFAPGYDPTGHFQTVTGDALNINLSSNVAVGGWIKYILV